MGGGAWSAAQNLTQTPNTDERYFSLAARNDGGYANLVFQASATNQAGTAVIGDRGSSPGNLVRRIAYLGRLLEATLSVGEQAAGVPSPLHSWPNPARGAVHFALDPARAGAAGGRLEVYALSGRLVARVSIGSDGRALWSGRDAAGRAVPSGVYLARVRGERETIGTKFMLLH